MLFNSIEFAWFLPAVFLLYWFIFNRSLKGQNLFVVVVSYLFYGWWDSRFLLLIAFTTLCSYYSGVLIERYRCKANGKKRTRRIAAANIILNLLILCIFKYFNFFAENLAEAVRFFGYEADWVTLDILLPVGISFYTFQALSYTIDVYKQKLEPTHDIISFFAFVSFFPQLVAGPIERASNLLPQFERPRQFDYTAAVDGMRQILWGLFKKIVVADNCAGAANRIFNDYAACDGGTLALGALLFTFQIYGDFSGYSDIAIGTARLFGIRLMRNFHFPYFSRDIAEFWRRWHISLNTWFRDYVYIPLGGSRNGKWKSFRNTVTIFLLSGLWHGANWTFVLWGAYHALLFAPLLLAGRNRKYTGTVAEGRLLPTFGETARILGTFMLVAAGWIVFRAENIRQAWGYFRGILGGAPWAVPAGADAVPLLGAGLMLGVEWIAREREFGLSALPRNKVLRWAVYLLLIVLIQNFPGRQNAFIYFQF